jgi:hypothetical protein
MKKDELLYLPGKFCIEVTWIHVVVHICSPRRNNPVYKCMHKLHLGGTLHEPPVPNCIILHYVLCFHLLSILNLKHQGCIWAMCLMNVHFESVLWNFNEMELVLPMMPMMVPNATFCRTLLRFIRYTSCPVSNCIQPWTLGSLLLCTMIGQKTSAVIQAFPPSHARVVFQSWVCIAIVMSCATVIKKYHHGHALVILCGMACCHVWC